MVDEILSIFSWKGIVWFSAFALTGIALYYTATLGAFGILAVAILVAALILDPLGMGVYDRVRRKIGGANK